MWRALILLGLGVLVVLVVFGAGSATGDLPASVEAADGPGFALRVTKPRSARPFFGILPDGAFGLPPNALGFDHESPGAAVVTVDERRLELVAEGWQVVIAFDEAGRVAPATEVTFSLELGPGVRTVRCRPGEGAGGSFSTTARAGARELDGEFHLELALCEDAASGAVLDWPPQPLTLTGSFTGLPRGRSPNR